MKKALALLAATAVLASAALTPAVGFTASAAGNGSIEISDSYSETYAAYQIFSGTITVQDGKEILTSIEWGSSITSSTDLLVALKADTVIGENFSNCESAEDVANVIKDFNNNSDDLIIFANIVAAFCGTASGTSSTNDGTISISNLESGYYLVAGTAADDPYTTTSRYILTEVNGNSGASAEAESANAKNALPSVQKFVWDEETDAETDAVSGWGESADHDTGETFKFALEASLPAEDELSYYNNYQITFHDTYNDGIEPDLSTIAVYVTTDTNGAWKTNGFSDISTYVDITSKCKPNGSPSDGCSFEVTVTDLVASLSDTKWSLGGTALSVIVVYDATLTQNATVWTGSVENGAAKTDKASNTVDDNVVYLTYSNNPNYAAIGESTDTTQQSGGKWKGLDYEDYTDQSGHTTKKPQNKTYDKDFGTTTKDYVWLFTYEIDITKKDEEGQALPGATFNLVQDSTTLYFTTDSDGNYWVADSDTEGATTDLVSGTDGKITIKGLDAGSYTLTETEAPDGYNFAENKEFTINATHAEDEGKITVSNDLSGSELSFSIEDKSGTTLPTTGGIGTTVFYVIGGIIVVGAGVLLITRKRANNV